MRQTNDIMLRLQTPVTDEECRNRISFQDPILMLGSCFTDNIGRQLQNFGFQVCINPFGTLYNPVSILNSLERISTGAPFTREECIGMGSGSPLICSFSHHTSAARKSEEEFLEEANRGLAQAHDFFKDCTCLIITLGTSWCFRHNGKGMTVSNCLKRDAKEFTRYRLDLPQTLAALERIVEIADGRKIIFTVSPIRHMKDGAHGNQLSKSNLLLAADQLIHEGGGRNNCDYFPAYEIMTDELRDYRFYSEDMVHPSDQAVRYIGERFLEWALQDKEKTLLEENIRKFKRSQHREMH